MHKFLYLVVSCLIIISCQQQENAILDHTMDCMQHTATIIHQNTQAEIATLPLKVRRSPYLQPIATCAEEMTPLKDTLLSLLEALQQKKSLTVEDKQIFAAAYQDLQQQYINQIAPLWNNGGVKGTIFADVNKRQEHLDRRIEKFESYSLSEDSLSVAISDKLFIAKKQQQVMALEQLAIRSLISQFGSIRIECFIKTHLLLNLPHYLRQHQKYSTSLGIALDLNGYRQDWMSVDDIQIKNHSYQINPAQTGMHYYQAKLEVSVPDEYEGQIQTICRPDSFLVVQ